MQLQSRLPMPYRSWWQLSRGQGGLHPAFVCAATSFLSVGQGENLRPWWIAEESIGHELCPPFYHSSTHLCSGQCSVIVVPGAWSNLMGADLARHLIVKAQGSGWGPTQMKMNQPLKIQGVGMVPWTATGC